MSSFDRLTACGHAAWASDTKGELPCGRATDRAAAPARTEAAPPSAIRRRPRRIRSPRATMSVTERSSVSVSVESSRAWCRSLLMSASLRVGRAARAAQRWRGEGEQRRCRARCPATGGGRRVEVEQVAQHHHLALTWRQPAPAATRSVEPSISVAGCSSARPWSSRVGVCADHEMLALTAVRTTQAAGDWAFRTLCQDAQARAKASATASSASAGRIPLATAGAQASGPCWWRRTRRTRDCSHLGDASGGRFVLVRLLCGSGAPSQQFAFMWQCGHNQRVEIGSNSLPQ